MPAPEQCHALECNRTRRPGRRYCDPCSTPASREAPRCDGCGTELREPAAMCGFCVVELGEAA